MGKPSLINCSCEKVAKALRNLGIEVIEGSKHLKAKHPKALRPFTIPRATKVNKHIMRALVTKFLKPLGFSEEEIYKHLRC